MNDQLKKQLDELLQTREINVSFQLGKNCKITNKENYEIPNKSLNSYAY